VSSGAYIYGLKVAADLFERALAKVSKSHPELDADEQRELARDWCAELAEEREQREDTPCLPEPWWTQR
jgi:hypothetical protein